MQVCSALAIDGAEVIALLDASRTIKRIAPPCAILVDIVVIALGIGGIITIATSDFNLGDDPNPHLHGWEGTDHAAQWTLVAIV